MNDERYQLHANTMVKRVIPEKDINYLVNLFMKDSSINMGSDFTDDTLDRTISIVKFEFSFLPVSFIASAFVQGSMGKYGPGRLVPRVIHGWLTESSNNYNKKQRHEDIEKKADYSQSMDLHRYPAGAAMIKKMDWLTLGVVTDSEYDRIPLKEVAERIGQGLEVVPELWGVKSKKPKQL